MNCREFTNQFDSGSVLSHLANEHLESCENCQTFHIEETQLSQMINSLPKVEAPKNFEFGFRSKLAELKLSKPISPTWQILRYALPFTAVALIFGFVVVNSSLFESAPKNLQLADKFAPEIKESSINKVSDENVESDEKLFAENDDKKPEEKSDDKKPSEKNETIVVDKIKSTEDKSVSGEITENKPQSEPKKDVGEEIFSRDVGPKAVKPEILTKDRALREEKSINPPGIDNKNDVKNPKLQSNAKSFSASEILSQLGIGTVKANGNLRVISIRTNSAGETSGVRKGDVVTAIDGESLSDISLRKRAIKGKTLKILRRSKPMTINIRNR